MSRSSLLILFLVLAACCGCVTVYQDAPQPAAVPPPPPLPVWAVYLPFPELPPHGTIRPIPANQGWTNLRMERDLSRMADAKICAALVVVTPVQLLGEDFHERYRKFAEVAASHGLKVALLVSSRTRPAPALERKNISQFVVSKGLVNLTNSLCVADGKQLLLIDEDFALDAPQPDGAPEVCIWQLGHDVPALPSGPLILAEMQPDKNGMLWVRAADNTGCEPYNRARPTDDWTIRRRNGAPLKRQLHRAREVGAKLLLLDSWNNYERGSFAEINSLDQDNFLKILKNR